MIYRYPIWAQKKTLTFAVANQTIQPCDKKFIHRIHFNVILLQKSSNHIYSGALHVDSYRVQTRLLTYTRDEPYDDENESSTHTSPSFPFDSPHFLPCTQPSTCRASPSDRKSVLASPSFSARAGRGLFIRLICLFPSPHETRAPYGLYLPEHSVRYYAWWGFVSYIGCACSRPLVLLCLPIRIYILINYGSEKLIHARPGWNGLVIYANYRGNYWLGLFRSISPPPRYARARALSLLLFSLLGWCRN